MKTKSPEGRPGVGTSAESGKLAGDYYRVPKKDLIAGLQLLLQQGAIEIAAKLELRPVLERELGDMRVKTTAFGREQFGAWREGQHDDLVLAVALACWGADKCYPNPPSGENAYWLGWSKMPDLKRMLEGE